MKSSRLVEDQSGYEEREINNFFQVERDRTIVNVARLSQHNGPFPRVSRPSWRFTQLEFSGRLD